MRCSRFSIVLLFSPLLGASAALAQATTLESGPRAALTRLASTPLTNNVADTALALLAFHSAGQPPQEGRFGLPVSALTEQLLAQLASPSSANGAFADLSAADTRTLSVVLLALTQSLSVEPDSARAALLRGAIQGVLPILLGRQFPTSVTPQLFAAENAVAAGGFVSSATATLPDLTGSAWAVFALRAADTAGFPVPRERFTGALRFALLCQTRRGAFAPYPPGPSDPPPGSPFQTTAAGAILLGVVQPPGVGALQSPPELDSALSALQAFEPPTTGSAVTDADALFFATVAFTLSRDSGALRYRESLQTAAATLSSDAHRVLCLTAPLHVLPAYPPPPAPPPALTLPPP